MPLDTVLLLDTSGSMAGRGMRELQRACKVFLDGVQETARESNLKENIAVVEFGEKARVVQSLTNDYNKCRRAIDSLKPGGRTPMFDGLMESLKEIITNGGVVKVCGRPLTPRVILMTDGLPTDEKGETDEARVKVIAAAKAFSPSGWRECGLPHPVPIACVGCGDCDPSLLDAIAKMTKGMFVIVENVAELSSFFRKQVLLIRFAAKFASDLDQLRSRMALMAFFRELGEAVEDAELDGLMQLLFAMLCLEAIVEAGASGGDDPFIDGLPPHGSRVRRGRNWKWGSQGNNMCGTVIKHDRRGVVEVEWDSGHENHYRMGAEGCYDLKIVDEPRVVASIAEVKPGCMVVRGRDWQWGTQDGGQGQVGVVYRVERSSKSVRVRWPGGTRGHYRNGKDGKYDLQLANQSMSHTRISAVIKTASFNIMPSLSPPKAPVSGSSPRKPPVEDQGKYCWQWQDNQGQWRTYTEDNLKKLEEIYGQNPNAVCKMVNGKFEYKINFESMRQVNTSTNASRPIRRTRMSQDDYDLALAIERSLQIL